MTGGPACAGTDTDTWFSTDRHDVAACVRICAGCPLRKACLAGAVARDEQWGIWGGRLFRPRWITGTVYLSDGWWVVRGRTVIMTTAFGGRFATRAEAEQRAAQLLADSARRAREAAAAGAAGGRAAGRFVGTDAA